MKNDDLEFIRKNSELLENGKKIINPEYSLCDPFEQQRYFEIINIFFQYEKPEEKFEEYKDFIFNPKFNTLISILVEKLSKRPEFHEFLKKNFKQIREASNIKDIVWLYKNIKEVLPEEYEKHKFVIEKIFNPSNKKLNDLQKAGKIAGKDFSTMLNLINTTCAITIINDKTKELEALIKSVTKDSTLEIIGMGANSIVMKTGNKIVKINSKERISDFDDINNPRILKPFIRENISTNEEQPLYVELQEEVDTTNITEEDVLEVYKELLEAGIKWCDPRISNLGRKDGKLVIIDLDYIFRADDPRAKLVSNCSRLVLNHENKYLPKIKPEEAAKNAFESLSTNKLNQARNMKEHNKGDKRKTIND